MFLKSVNFEMEKDLKKNQKCPLKKIYVHRKLGKNNTAIGVDYLT